MVAAALIGAYDGLMADTDAWSFLMMVAGAVFHL